MNFSLEALWESYGLTLDTISFIIGVISSGGIILGLFAAKNYIATSTVRKAVFFNYIPINIICLTDRKSKKVMLVVRDIKDGNGTSREVYDLPQGHITEDTENENAEDVMLREFGLDPNDYRIMRRSKALPSVKIEDLDVSVEHSGFTLPLFSKTKPRGKTYFVKHLVADITTNEHGVVERIGYSKVELGPTNTKRAELLSFDKAKEKLENSRINKREKNKLPVLYAALKFTEQREGKIKS